MSDVGKEIRWILILGAPKRVKEKESRGMEYSMLDERGVRGTKEGENASLDVESAALQMQGERSRCHERGKRFAVLSERGRRESPPLPR